MIYNVVNESRSRYHMHNWNFCNFHLVSSRSKFGWWAEARDEGWVLHCCRCSKPTKYHFTNYTIFWKIQYSSLLKIQLIWSVEFQECRKILFLWNFKECWRMWVFHIGSIGRHGYSTILYCTKFLSWFT